MPSSAKAKRHAAKKAARDAKLSSGAAAHRSDAPSTATDAATPLADRCVILPASLNPRQRAALHEVCGRLGIPHESTGSDASRRLQIGTTIPGGAPEELALPERADAGPGDAGVADDVLAAALLPLGIDAKAELTHRRPAAPRRAVFDAAGVKPRRGQGAGALLGRAGVRVAEYGSAAAFAEAMLPLLNAEWEEELAQAQEAHSSGGAEGKGRGAVVANLKCVGAEGGLLGRSLLTFVANKGDGANPIPPHKLSQNDMVDVRPSKGAAAGPPTASGVVYRITERTIVVAVDDLPDEGLNVPLRLEKLANEVTHRRLKDTLTQLTQAAASGTASASPGAHLIDIVFGGAVPRFHEAPLEWEPIDRGLDDSQVKAVGRALAARDVALIHGPPGTGKTTAVVEVIKQEVARGRRVLACAASNIAVDNIVERVAAPAPGGASEGAPLVVRVGHPARLLPQVLSCSLEAHVLRSDNSALAQDCRREIREHSAALSKLEGWKRAERGKLQAELRRLAREERKRQEAAVEEVLRKADVVCCTLTGLHVRHMRNLVFDVCIVDEAAQALEVATWGALLRAPRAILAGDHLQLPPTVLSPQGEAGGLGCTLFERLIALYGESGVSEMLLTQYRMHADIMQWSSGALYENKLEAHPSVAAHKLEDIAPRAAADGGDEPFPALMLVDTAGCDMWEAEGEGGSWRNDGEVEVVLALLDRLDAAGVAASRVGVISPYSAQVGALREARGERYEGVEISTVDGFQGREKEAIIISAVRSNDRREVGFLSDKRRMNVAVTRARRHCCLICDSETLSSDAFLAQLVQHFEEHGTVSTAEEFAQGWS